MATASTVSGSVPVLVTVTVCGALVTPTGWVKESDEVLTLTVAPVRTADPKSGIEIGSRPSMLMIR